MILRKLYLLIFLLSYTCLSVTGQSPNGTQRLSLLKEVDQLIADYQKYKLQLSRNSGNRFLNLFYDRTNTLLEDDLFPNNYDSKTYTACPVTIAAYYQNAVKNVRKPGRKFHKFQNDISNFFSRADFRLKRSYVDFDQELSYRFDNGDSIYTTSNIRVWINYSLAGNQAQVDIAEIERRSITHTLFQKKKVGLQLEGGTYFPMINNLTKQEETQLFDEVSVSKSLGVFGNVLFPVKILPVHAGIGLSYYNSQITVSSFQASLLAEDPEQDQYFRNITGTGLSESLSVLMLNIPIRYKKAFNINSSKYAVILGAGVNLEVPLKFTSIGQNTGTFSYRGYYPQYSWEAVAIPEFDLYENESLNQSPDPGIAPFLITGELQAALSWTGKNGRQHSLGLSFRYLVNSFNKPDNTNVLTESKNELRSISQFISYKYWAPGLTYTMQLPTFKKVVLKERGCK